MLPYGIGSGTGWPRMARGHLWGGVQICIGSPPPSQARPKGPSGHFQGRQVGTNSRGRARFSRPKKTLLTAPLPRIPAHGLACRSLSFNVPLIPILPPFLVQSPLEEQRRAVPPPREMGGWKSVISPRTGGDGHVQKGDRKHHKFMVQKVGGEMSGSWGGGRGGEKKNCM